MNPDRFDDDDDIPSTPPRKGKRAYSRGLIGLWCALLVAVVLLGGGFVLFAMRTSADMRERTAQDAVAAHRKVVAQRALTRDTFKLMKGSTPKEIVAMFGQPSSKVVEPARTIWTYENKTTDPATGKFDPPIKVVFEGGIVVEVNF